MDQNEKRNQDSAPVVIDGRVLHKDDVIHELVEVAEEGPSQGLSREVISEEELRREVARATERVAREMIPGIVERIMLEEIMKLKRGITK